MRLACLGVAAPIARTLSPALLLWAAAGCGADAAQELESPLGTPALTADAAVDAGQLSGDGDGLGGNWGDVSSGDAGSQPTLDAGAGGEGPGDASTDATVESGPFMDGALCHLDANQVGLVGDSYLHLSGKITSYLQESARAVGAIGPNDVYLDHSLSGASLNGVPDIPSQWPDVLADAERRGSKGVKLVIGTGGGNDVLVNHRECLDFPTEADMTDGCKQVVTDAVNTGQMLFDQAGMDGVEAIIYFFYPHLPKDSYTGLQGQHPNTMLDYAYPHVKKLCDEHVNPPCFFIDTRPPFEGKQASLVTVEDGIHPTNEGSKIIADMIWDIMQTQCIGAQ